MGGNARTALVINISPCDADASESLSSLSFGQRAMAVATRAHRNIEVDYKALYATVQSALDEKDDEIRRLEIQQGKKEAQVEMLLNSLSESKLAAQRAEAEMKLLRITSAKENKEENQNAVDDAGIQNGGLFSLTAVGGNDENEHSNNNSSTDEDWRKQLDSLREEYSENLKTQQMNNDKKLKEEKEKRLNAEEEWNRMEYDLRGEREEHLRTCIQLKECRAQLTKLDRTTTDRIGELTNENHELNELLEKKKNTLISDANKENILKQELAKSGGKSVCCVG